MNSDREVISAAIKLLPADKKEQLKLAHEYGIAQYILINNQKVIGVHLLGIPHLLIEHEHNDWFLANFKEIK